MEGEAEREASVSQGHQGSREGPTQALSSQEWPALPTPGSPTSASRTESGRFYY